MSKKSINLLCSLDPMFYIKLSFENEIFPISRFENAGLAINKRLEKKKQLFKVTFFENYNKIANKYEIYDFQIKLNKDFNPELFLNETRVEYSESIKNELIFNFSDENIFNVKISFKKLFAQDIQNFFYFRKNNYHEESSEDGFHSDNECVRETRNKQYIKSEGKISSKEKNNFFSEHMNKNISTNRQKSNLKHPINEADSSDVDNAISRNKNNKTKKSPVKKENSNKRKYGETIESKILTEKNKNNTGKINNIQSGSESSEENRGNKKVDSKKSLKNKKIDEDTSFLINSKRRNIDHLNIFSNFNTTNNIPTRSSNNFNNIYTSSNYINKNSNIKNLKKKNYSESSQESSEEKPRKTKTTAKIENHQTNSAKIIPIPKELIKNTKYSLQEISNKEIKLVSVNKSNNSKINNCTICLEEVTNKAILNNCCHEYCYDCIKQWSDSSNLCPLCKKSFTYILV